MQDRAVLRVVDMLTRKHALDPVGHLSLLCEPQEKLQACRIQSLPTEIQPQALGLRGKGIAATEVRLEERGDGSIGEFGGGLLQCPPGLGAGTIRFSSHRGGCFRVIP